VVGDWGGWGGGGKVEDAGREDVEEEGLWTRVGDGGSRGARLDRVLRGWARSFYGEDGRPNFFLHFVLFSGKIIQMCN
jgi:hypothetical protein